MPQTSLRSMIEALGKCFKNRLFNTVAFLFTMTFTLTCVYPAVQYDLVSSVGYTQSDSDVMNLAFLCVSNA